MVNYFTLLYIIAIILWPFFRYLRQDNGRGGQRSHGTADNNDGGGVERFMKKGNHTEGEFITDVNVKLLFNFNKGE